MRAHLIARELLASGARHVRTPAGAKHFGQPVGSVIVPDVVPTTARKIVAKSSVDIPDFVSTEIRDAPREVVMPSMVKVGDWIDLPREKVVVPMMRERTLKDEPALIGRVTDIEKRGKGMVITVTGPGGKKRQIGANRMMPPMRRILTRRN